MGLWPSIDSLSPRVFFLKVFPGMGSGGRVPERKNKATRSDALIADLWEATNEMGCCSMNNKNIEIKIGVYPQNQRNKASRPPEKSSLSQGWATTNSVA